MYGLVLWALAAFAASNPPIRAGEQQRRIWASAGWDPAVQLDLGASVPLAQRGDSPAPTGEVFAGLSPPLVLRGVPSVSLGAGSEVSLRGGVFRITGAVYGTARTASDVTGFLLALGSTEILRAGVGGRPGALAVESAVASAWSTYRAPSSGVRALYGDREGALTADAPRAGFFFGTSHRARLGLASALRLSESVELSLAAGYAHTPHANGRIMDVPVVPMPFYASLGCGVRL